MCRLMNGLLGISVFFFGLMVLIYGVVNLVICMLVCWVVLFILLRRYLVCFGFLCLSMDVSVFNYF